MGQGLRTRALGFRRQAVSNQCLSVMAIPETQAAGDIYASISSDHHRDMKDRQRVDIHVF